MDLAANPSSWRVKRPPERRGMEVGARLMRHVARKLVLQSQFFFFQAVEKVFVGVGAVLFFVDESVKRGMLRLECLDYCPVHWRRSFQAMSPGRNKSPFARFVLPLVAARRASGALRREPGAVSAAARLE
jgi:hypothetical protein